MPGNIRVAVLEAVDLPATVSAGKSVAVKVAVGKREFQTNPAETQDGRTPPWNSEFIFPVLNLRDNLVVAIMNSEGDVIARAELDTPGIVQRGSQDAFIALKAGGRIHMKVSFLLSEEERKKIEAMRAASLKKRKGFSNQSFRARQAPVSSVKITEITSDDSPGRLETVENVSQRSPKVLEEVARNDDNGDKVKGSADNKFISKPAGDKPDIRGASGLASKREEQTVAEYSPRSPPVVSKVCLKSKVARSLASPDSQKYDDGIQKIGINKSRQLKTPLALEKAERVPALTPPVSLASHDVIKGAVTENKVEEKIEGPLNGKRKGFSWFSMKPHDERSQKEKYVKRYKAQAAVEGSRWLEDLKLKSQTDKHRAAKADDSIKRLEKQMPARKQGEPKLCVPGETFKQESLTLKRHLEEEGKRLKYLEQKRILETKVNEKVKSTQEGLTNASDQKRPQKTVKQRLEDWRLKELGPWKRTSSKVRHASPPESGQSTASKGSRWLLKNSHKPKIERGQKPSVEAGLAIEEQELMAAADRIWASAMSEDNVSEGSSLPEQSNGKNVSRLRFAQDSKKGSGGVKGLVKQVISGAAVVAGAFMIWPRKGFSKKQERYHIVKDGETLSSIVPGECENPDSNFFKLNPDVRDKNVIYPGQRLRLS